MFLENTLAGSNSATRLDLFKGCAATFTFDGITFCFLEFLILALP
jgi:hypothetical protein